MDRHFNDLLASLSCFLVILWYVLGQIKDFLRSQEEISLMREKIERYSSVSKDITTLAMASIEENARLRETLKRISDAVDSGVSGDFPSDGVQGVPENRTQGP